jgi:hypothetical protein
MKNSLYKNWRKVLWSIFLRFRIRIGNNGMNKYARESYLNFKKINKCKILLMMIENYCISSLFFLFYLNLIKNIFIKNIIIQYNFDHSIILLWKTQERLIKVIIINLNLYWVML